MVNFHYKSFWTDRGSKLSFLTWACAYRIGYMGPHLGKVIKAILSLFDQIGLIAESCGHLIPRKHLMAVQFLELTKHILKNVNKKSYINVPFFMFITTCLTSGFFQKIFLEIFQQFCLELL